MLVVHRIRSFWPFCQPACKQMPTTAVINSKQSFEKTVIGDVVVQLKQQKITEKSLVNRTCCNDYEKLTCHSVHCEKRCVPHT